MPSLDRTGDVFHLHLGSDENRWNPEWMRAVLAGLDAVEAAPEPRALVTVASGKYWSTGLDLDWLQSNPDDTAELSNLFHVLLARMLTLAAPTVAAIGGHAFGAGAMFALAHDFRVMRSDKGFWCLPEADIGMPYTDGTAALVQAKLTPSAAHRAMITASRYSGEAALAAGIVDVAAPEAALERAAQEIAEPLAAKPSANLGAIKLRMYRPVHAALVEDSTRY